MPRLGDDPITEADDDRLVRRTLDGDRQAFGVLIERYSGRVIAICARVAGDEYEDAQDVAQDVFLRAYLNLEKYQPGRSFFAWLYRIAVNLALNRRARRPPAAIRGPAAERALQQLQDPDPLGAPEASLERTERTRLLQTALARLPADYATVLALRYGADLDYSAIAATLEVPIGTVKARLHRAKTLLRPLLAPLHEEGATP
ncbi:MAG TPA: sigma-70 family RNA polymerase sigma factor [Chloroflexia bacterium]|nr:sigma-70 family RNA polymerase sigma factor [Chloroflexia bacterium]